MLERIEKIAKEPFVRKSLTLACNIPRVSNRGRVQEEGGDRKLDEMTSRGQSLF